MKSDMIKNLEERSLSLRKAVDKAKRCLGKAPEGHLQYSTSKRTNTIQYFHRTDPKSTHGKYIPVSKRKLAVSLAQKDYMKRLLPVAQKEQTLIENLLSFYNSTMTMEELYSPFRNPAAGSSLLLNLRKMNIYRPGMPLSMSTKNSAKILRNITLQMECACGPSQNCLLLTACFA